ncbi:MAG: calcium-binding protein, partial [Betaproteobacteria bacterium]|nr:calcium-binding protein [Betaproteobacteria bacterium]
SFSDDGYATLSQDSFVNGSGTLALIQGEPAAFVTSFQKSDGSTSQSTLTAWDLKGKQLTSGQLTPSYYDVDRTELSVAGGKVTVLRQVDGPLGTALLLSRVSATDGTADGGFDPIATVNSARLQFKALDPTILVVDADLESLGSYAGASVLLSRRGGANADDQFSYPTTGGLFNQAGQPQALVLDGITVADVLRNTAGVLELRFTPQATPRTTNQALQSIQYANDRAAPGDSLEIEWIFNDGNTGAQAVGTNDVSAKTAKSYTRVRFVSNPSDSADRLVGSTAADTIDGLAGNDTMDGMAGDDSLLGGLGDDNLSGGAGNDILRGQDGDDYFIAGGSAGAGSDTLDGGSNGTFGDTVDYAAATAGVVVDLTTGVASDGGGGSDVLIDIEHVTATRFDDNLRGNSSTNWFRPGAGNDTVDGQAGRDVVMYEDATAGVEIDLRAGVARSASSVDAGVGNDILISIEAAHGSRFDDKVTLSDAGGYVFGRAGNDTLIGGAGSDNLIPGSGNDSIDGGEGYDTVDYFDDGYDGASAPSVGIVADLAAGTVIDNWGFTDRISNIENIRGTGFSDRIVGDGASNNLFGGAGDDTILGFGGNDYIEGGPGNDSLDGGTITDQVLFTDGNTLTYQNSPAAVDVNFQTGIASDGFGGIDQISNFTWVIGSPYNDRLVGFNTIFQDYNGGLGNDTIDGGGGSDRINARSATSSVLIDFALGRMVGGGLG